MEITVNEYCKIFTVQKEFSDMFPYLKLEFYSKPHKEGGNPSPKPMKHISKTIAECSTVHSSEHITIQPQMTTGELEKHFREVFGLSIRLFLKSGDAWLETAAGTDDWTLDKQNAAGRELNKREKVN